MSVVIVTGGTFGLGQSITVELARRGHQVVAFGLAQPQVSSTAQGLDSMLQARDKLDQGYLVGMLADRGLGDDATIDCEFLGETASFPLGPWRLAAMLRRPVFFMTGLYLGGNRYQIHFEPLADFSQTPREQRDTAIRTACHTERPRTTGEVYGCLGCSPQCGRCARTSAKAVVSMCRFFSCDSRPT